MVDIANKFSDYIEFKVNEEEFTKYIEENFPVDECYLKLFEDEDYDGNFPYDLIKKDKELRKKEEKEGIEDKESKGYNDFWYNARFLQTIKAFPIYKKLLTDCNATDYAFMQAKALEMLKENSKTKYKNILVDEFQDTDPIQVQIFEILMEEALKNNSPGNIQGTFTAVGDMNQNIYGFRGASFNYFKQLDEERPCKNLSLNVNHRSTNQIVKLTEEFINSNNEDSNIHLSAAKDINRDCYYIKNQTKEDEAINLVNIIEHLVNTGKTEYKDILVLFRSVTYSAPKFIEELEKEDIPYNARGIGDLSSNDLIKSVISFIDFIVQFDDDGVPLYSKDWAWLSPKAFTGEEFDQKLVNLSDETKF
ncbi:MAG: ATP-dependent helicase [archaeon]|nr:ATP-dependent helicase [archaeon]